MCATGEITSKSAYHGLSDRMYSSGNAYILDMPYDNCKTKGGKNKSHKKKEDLLNRNEEVLCDLDISEVNRRGNAEDGTVVVASEEESLDAKRVSEAGHGVRDGLKHGT